MVPGSPVDAAALSLRRHLPAANVLTGAAAAPRSWNLAVTSLPAVRVRCTDEHDVRQAVHAARDAGLPLSVLGRGYDWAGGGVVDGGLVVDVSGLRTVTVDPDRGTCTVGGGTSSLELAAAAQPFGLAPVTGWIGGAGLVGLALGSGHGPLCGRAGLVGDNLLGARVVLADGALVDTDDDPDLLWALRHGGHVGVVVSARFALHPVPVLVSGTMAFPWSRARTVLRRAADLVRAAPDELTVRVGLVASQGAPPTLLVSPVWSGDTAHWMGSPGPVPELRSLGDPISDDVAPGTLTSLLSEGDERCPRGRHLAVRSRLLPGLHDAAVGALVEAGDSVSSPLSRVWLHHVHGVGVRNPADPLDRRPTHLVAEVVAAWDEPGGAALHRIWAERTDALLSWAADLRTSAEPGSADDAAAARARRALDLRRRYDPDGVFAVGG